MENQQDKNQIKNPENLKKAIAVGQAAINDGKTKVEAVKLMYPLISKEHRETIWGVFREGAGLTEKGAITYLYNLIREAKKKTPSP